MSDDEYYADSPYDEFEEVLWDADPRPDLADELAEHAAYSPVWQDDPIGELEQYHSDWEYYSDDYYDDDPAMLKRNTLDGSPQANRILPKVQAQKRGRKRKLDEAREPPVAAAKRSLEESIKGTVWAETKPEEVNFFRHGQQEKVALLTDWKEKFQLDDGGQRTFGKGQLKRDESWANDLSLADMGLRNERERPAAQPETSMEEEEGSNEEQLDNNMVQNAVEEGETSMHYESQVFRRHSRAGKTESTIENGHLPQHVDKYQPGIAEDATLQKKRKISTLPSPPRSSESNTTMGLHGTIKQTTSVLSQHEHPGGGTRGRPNKHQPGQPTEILGGAETTQPKPERQGRKRKLSPASGADEGDARSSAANSRGKRVASATYNDGENKSLKEKPPPPRTTPVTRSRQK